MIFFALRSIRPGDRQSTAVALASAVGIALAGAVVWGLISLMFHVQLSLLGVLIGAGVGAAVARFRHSHMPTIIAGAVIAVAGCALGTLLSEVFYLLNQQIPLSDILAHLNLLLRAYPSNVGALGVLFYAIAAFAAIRVPMRARPAGPMPAFRGHAPAPMTGPTPAPASGALASGPHGTTTDPAGTFGDPAGFREGPPGSVENLPHTPGDPEGQAPPAG